MQHHVQATQTRIVTNFGGQAIAVHFRHFRIGEDHQQLVGHVHAGIRPGLEHVQRLQAIAGNVHFYPELAEGVAQLRKCHVGVVHQQHFTATGALEHRIIEFFTRDLGVVRDDFGEDFLDVDDFHQLIVDLADRGQIVLTPGAGRRRQNGFPVHVDDAIHTAHQEGLHRAVVFGDDDRAVGPRHQRTHTDRLRQIDHRQGLTAQIDHSAYKRVTLRHQSQFRQLQHFLNLEHVDREQLTPGQSKHENFQAILTHQLRALVYRVENAGHQ
ncbi:hypothetical protein D3C84_751440 [compost metagenome]